MPALFKPEEPFEHSLLHSRGNAGPVSLTRSLTALLVRSMVTAIPAPAGENLEFIAHAPASSSIRPTAPARPP